MWIRVAILAIIASLIGWITNILAVRLIFRPINEIKIPLIGYKMQGLIPKRRREIAKSIGETIERELISVEEILSKVIEEQNKEQIIVSIKIKIGEVIHEKIPSLIPKSIKDIILSYVEDLIDQEAESALDEMLENLIDKTCQNINIAEIVEEKINEFDLIKLEEIIINIANRELKQIERLGAILGFIIGIIQGVIIIFI